MRKKFVKSLFVVVAMVVALALGSCNVDDDKPVAPEIKGVQAQMVAFTGEEIDLLAGITATGKHGEDVTDYILVYHSIPMVDGKLTQSGFYTIRYELKIDGVVETQAYAQLEVKYKKPEDTDTMIFNGDFKSGSTDPFILQQFDNGFGTFKVQNEELVVDITNIAEAMAFPRVDYNDLELDPEKIYEVRFDARANVSRWIHVQLGELINQAPWFKEVAPSDRFFQLTTEMQTFSFRFKPSTTKGADMSKISLLFEFGKMKGESILTSCFLDNIVMEEVDSLGEDKFAPVITAPDTFTAYVGEAFNLVVTAEDDVDGDVTDLIVVSGDTLPVDENGKLTTEGNYSITYTVEDKAGNKATKTVSVTVAPARQFADPDNLFGTPLPTVVCDAAGTGGEEHSKAYPHQWHVWYTADDSWGGFVGTTLVVPSYVDGVLTLVATQGANTNHWANQFFYTTLPFEEGGQYVLTAKINSTKAGKITFAGKVVDLVVGDNLVEVNISVSPGEAFTLACQFGTVENGPIGDVTLKVSEVSIDANESVEYADPDNLWGTPASEVVYSAEGAGSQDNSKTNPNKWHLWNISNAGWGIGPVTTFQYSYVDGVVSISVNQNGNTNFWANQLFYTTLPIENGGNFILKLKINSSVAGKIAICGQDVELVVGVNDVELTVNVPSKTAFTFACSLGTETTGPIGDIEISFSDFSLEPSGEAPVYADPDHLMGSFSELLKESGLAEEKDAKANPHKIVVWFDQGGWIGTPAVVNYHMEGSTLVVESTQPAGSCWFATQVFYSTLPIKNAGEMALTLKINSTKAGQITINETVVNLVVGDNNVKVKVNVANETAFTLSLQLGVEATLSNIGDATIKISDVSLGIWS